MTDEKTRVWLALITAITFFGVAGLIVIPAGLGLTDPDVMKDVLAVWASTAGPLTGGAFGYFFGTRRNVALPPQEPPEALEPPQD